MVAVAAHVDAEDSGAVFDFRGDPFDKTRTGGWLGAGLILVTELAERIVAQGITMNLVTYLVGDLHISTSKSANIVTNFSGTLNMFALLGGFLADAKLGRYLTVGIFATLTAVGVTLITIDTAVPSLKPPPCSNFRQQHHQCVEADGGQLAILYIALYTIALGGGCIKSNVSGFGSDQFDVTDPKGEKAMVFFFNRFYFCVCLGSLFAVTILVYIQDNVGRGYGYGISAGAMVIAVLIFLGGTPFYRFKKPKGSPLTIIGRVFYLAWRKRSLPYPTDPSLLNEYHNSTVPHTERIRCLDKAAILDGSEEKGVETLNPWKISTMTQVEEVKMVLKLLPIWSTCILFWTVYSQMTTLSVEQATIMNRNMGSFLYPAGSMSFFIIITILIITSLNEKVLIPIARRFTQNPKGLTSLQRVSIGLIFSIFAMVTAATVEKQRRHFAVHKGIKISVFWLIPQYFLVGAGEAFAYVGQLEFFIREAPEKMKSMSTGLFLTTIAMGFYLSSLLVSLVGKVTNNRWITNNLNKGKLENFYWLLAFMGVLNFILFIFFAMRHQYKVEQKYNLKSGDLEDKELKGWNDGGLEEKKEGFEMVE